MSDYARILKQEALADKKELASYTSQGLARSSAEKGKKILLAKELIGFL
jgi:hypothetical protein